jgi:hypothetical protein
MSHEQSSTAPSAADAGAPLVRISHVDKDFGTFQALTDVNLEAPRSRPLRTSSTTPGPNGPATSCPRS